MKKTLSLSQSGSPPLKRIQRRHSFSTLPEALASAAARERSSTWPKQLSSGVAATKQLASAPSLSPDGAVPQPQERANTYRVDFGTLPVRGTRVSLEGDIYCPFPYVNRLDEAAIAKATTASVDWAVQKGLCGDDSSSRGRLTSQNFARFAAFTTLHFTPDVVGAKSLADIPGANNSEKINHILKASTPISTEGLTRKTKYLTLLFPHDNWAEQQDCLTVLRYVHSCLNEVFSGRETASCFDVATYHSIIDAFEAEQRALKGDAFVPRDRDKELRKINGFLNCLQDLSVEYSRGFSKLNKGSTDCLGFSDFATHFNNYLLASEDEARNRLSGKIPNFEKFTAKRLNTSAVYTVYIASLLEAGVPIKRETSQLAFMKDLADNFSHVICRVNAFLSGPREAGTPNWQMNDICILLADRPGYSEQDAVRALFKLINDDMKEAEATLLAEVLTLEHLLYIAIVMTWGIGSIPAQMTSGRYDEGRDKPFVPDEQKCKVGGDFWRYLAPAQLVESLA